MPKLIITIMLICTFARAGEWEIVGSMLDPVYGGQALAHGNYIYILGGYSDSLKKPVNKIQIYDPNTNQWKMSGNMLHPRYAFAADILNDSSLVYCGGIWNNSNDALSIEFWNPSSDSFGSAAVNDYNLNFNRIYFTGHIYNNFFYIFGGLPTPSAVDTVSQPFIVRYNLNNRNTIPLQEKLYEDTSLPYLHMSVRIDSIVFLMGGVHFNVSNRVSIFNLNSHELTAIGALKMVRAGGDAVAFNDEIYVIGGFSESQNALNSVERFRPGPNIIVDQSRLNYARNELMAVVFNDEIYVFGGKNEFDINVPQIEKMNLISVSTTEKPQIPEKIVLYDNYPNPFNPITTIRFDLNRPDYLTLSIYDITGKLICTLFDGFVPAGDHRFLWNGTDSNHRVVTSGMYLYRLSSSSQSIVKKMLLVK
jgi:hypothetical protein